MRAILVLAIMLFGLTGAAPETDYSSLSPGIRDHNNALDGLVEIEAPTHRGDRLALTSLGPRILRVDVLRPEDRGAPLRLATLDGDLAADAANAQAEAPTTPPQPTALDNLCNALFASAQDNDLPVPFFANLLWQESRLRADDVSKKGAQGIARVDRVATKVKNAQGKALGLQGVEQLGEVARAAGEAVELRHDERVAFARVVERRL